VGAISLEGVTKRYADVTAVDDFSLEIANREFLVLLGPSGCGKSTVLRMIAGLDEPDEGLISIGDRIVNHVEPKDRDLAMVFQSYALYPQMTVRANLEFPLRTRRVPAEEREQIVRECSEMLGLEELLDRKPSQLSGGQRQRVALGRAIVRRPAAFLMDEPLSNLDAKLRLQTRAELIELQQRLQTTVVYVTHDQVEAMTMGDRIAVMERGALQQVGPPQQIYDEPASVFVAGFIGTPPMNAVEGRVEAARNPMSGAATDGLVLSIGSAEVPLPAPMSAALRGAGLQTVIIGVRPEHLEIRPDGELPALVTVVESLGHERHVVCRIDGEHPTGPQGRQGQMVIARQDADEVPPRTGDLVRLSTQPEHLHAFDPETGLRVAPAA
jgi:ABC-type sugar transport system ATPase subunit